MGTTEKSFINSNLQCLPQAPCYIACEKQPVALPTHAQGLIMLKSIRNSIVFVIAYIVLMLPTYGLPYLGSNSAIAGVISAAAGWGPSFAWWAHMWCLTMLVLLCWMRGQFIGKNYLPVFPFLAAIFDMVPGLNLIPLIPTVLHIVAIIIGVKNTALDIAGMPSDVAEIFIKKVQSTTKIVLLCGASFTALAILGSAYFLAAVKPSNQKTSNSASNKATTNTTPTAPAESAVVIKQEGNSSIITLPDGKTARIQPAFPTKPMNVIYDTEVISQHSENNYQGYIKLTREVTSLANNAFGAAVNKVPANTILKIVRLEVLERPPEYRFLKDGGDSCTQKFKANDIVYPIAYSGDGGYYHFAFVEGEPQLRKGFCSGELKDVLVVSNGGSNVNVYAKDKQGAPLFFNPLMRGDDYQELPGDGFKPWITAKTVAQDKTNMRFMPKAEGDVKLQLAPNTAVEVQDNGQEWLLVRKIGSETETGFVKRDRLVLNGK